MQVLKSFRKSLYTIAIFVCVFILLGFLYIKFINPVEYTSNAKIYAESTEKTDSDSAKTFAESINSNSLKKEVMESLGLNWTIEEFDKKVKIEPTEDSQIINIFAKDTIELRAADLTDEMADKAVVRLNTLYNNDAKVIEYGYQNTQKVDQVSVIYKFILVGFVISLIKIFINVKYDDTIYYIDELDKDYNILAMLPEFDAGDLNEE
ncbi:MAG: Wzz/FepE/Etk N-terminal domain-containing protein [Tissierellia bacterium]|nr:Wzz/FepE/Etk N-terminal domain-containing protein [Tissierellia bacterium]